MSHRTLLLMRHAKSAYPAGLGDHQRPLNKRGRQEAAVAGDVIRAMTGAPVGSGWPSGSGGIDMVLCSTAQRTRETLQRTGIQAPTEFSDAIYEATAPAILDQIRDLGQQAGTVLVIGHAPGIPGLLADLIAQAGLDGTSDQARELFQRRGFPTSAVAVLRTSQQWAELDAAALVDYRIPRDE